MAKNISPKFVVMHYFAFARPNAFSFGNFLWHSKFLGGGLILSIQASTSSHTSISIYHSTSGSPITFTHFSILDVHCLSAHIFSFLHSILWQYSQRSFSLLPSVSPHHVYSLLLPDTFFFPCFVCSCHTRKTLSLSLKPRSSLHHFFHHGRISTNIG